MENEKIIQSTKWSIITELLAKVMTPVINIILARLLKPEVFGVVATLTMVATFAEVFTDAGFQKFLIQHDFVSEKSLYDSATVAFWTNLAFSFLIWVLIILFREDIASFAGSPGYEKEVAVMSAQIPLVAFSSIQTALFRRTFKFKQLLPIRIAVVSVPFFVTVPLAIITRNCWALIIGSVAREMVNATLLTIKSDWKPKWYYNINILKEMLDSSVWMMIDSLLVWCSSYADIFILGRLLSSTELGFYKVGTTTVSPYINLIYTMTAPVLYAGLSRLQKSKEELDSLFLNYQKYASYFVLFIGAFVFQNRNLVSLILLGKQWAGIELLLGLYSFTHSICVITAQYNSDYFRAIGKPRISFLVQGLYMITTIVVIMIFSRISFNELIIARGLLGISYVIFSASAIGLLCNVSIKRSIKNLFPSFLATVSLFLMSSFTDNFVGEGLVSQIMTAIIGGFSYLAVLIILPSSRRDLLNKEILKILKI